ETAAKSAGASVADWNTETKILTVAYNNQKTNLSKIEKAVAASGYDTQNLTASEEAYNKLHSCCQYDRKAVANATTASLTIKADDCCSDSKAMDCCKDGKCTMVKDGKTMDCCKDGKCTMSKDDKTMDCCKDNKCSASDCCKKA